jgi:hypothetical protein
MTARRRPISTLFVALLVWLTGVSTASAARVQERRLSPATSAEVSTVTTVAPRATVVVAREVTRLPALGDDHPAILPTVDRSIASTPRVHVAVEIDSSARRAERIRSAYDATAPPVMAATIG